MIEMLPNVVLSTAAIKPHRVAIRTGNAALSFGELAAATDRLASAVETLGREDERVGLLLPNHPFFPVALYGVLRAGKSAVLLNPVCSARDFAESLADAGAVQVLTTRELASRLPSGCRPLLVDSLAGGLEIGSDGTIDTVPPGSQDPERVSDPNAEAVVVYTAAMDGRARGARLSHRNLVANLRSTVEAMQLRPEDRVLAVLPLIHLFGLTVTLNAPLSVGATVLPVERFHPNRILEMLEREGVTVFAGVPAMYGALLSAATRRGVPTHRLRVAICGGAPLAPDLGERWEELFGLPLRQGYGLTEAAPVCLFNRVDRANRPGTLGDPFPGVEVSIRDPSGGTLSHGEVGEICVRGPNVFLGYVGDQGHAPGSFHGDALRTGDLGSIDPDGSVRFRGVLKPMFTRNGFNVYPRELERVLGEDPRIGEARVYASPDPLRENEIVLWIRTAAGAELSEEEVRAICAERLAEYKQPGRILLDRGDSPSA